jgi:hypothetical protein
MANLTNRPPPGLKNKTPKKNKQYLEWLHTQSCVVCQRFGENQNSPTQAHHVIHDRFSNVKTPDIDAIPLCEGHHQGMFDTSKIALHRSPQEWRDTYGDDHSYSEMVRSRYPKKI